MLGFVERDCKAACPPRFRLPKLLLTVASSCTLSVIGLNTVLFSKLVKLIATTIMGLFWYYYRLLNI
jgi:hypothetical protein